MKNLLFKTKNFTIIPIHAYTSKTPPLSSIEAAADLPKDLYAIWQNMTGEDFFRTAWQAVRRDTTSVFAWIWFDNLSVERRDVMVHISFCESQPEKALVTELFNEIRFRAISQKGIFYLYTHVEDNMISSLESCGFELMRYEGDRLILEYRKHSSGRVPLYALLAVLLFIPTWIFLKNSVAAVSVSLCLALGGGFIYDSIHRDRFATYRAGLIFTEKS